MGCHVEGIGTFRTLLDGEPVAVADRRALCRRCSPVAAFAVLTTLSPGTHRASRDVALALVQTAEEPGR